MPSDREQEIHHQPPECGNCGAFFRWDEDAGRWVSDCRCHELEPDAGPAPWEEEGAWPQGPVEKTPRIRLRGNPSTRHSYIRTEGHHGL